MEEHPILMNRPCVVTPKGTRLCRPSEAVLEILPNPDIGSFSKEDARLSSIGMSTGLYSCSNRCKLESNRRIPVIPVRFSACIGRVLQ